MYYKVCINSEKMDAPVRKGLNGTILEVEFINAKNDSTFFKVKETEEIIILPTEWIYWMIPIK